MIFFVEKIVFLRYNIAIMKQLDRIELALVPYRDALRNHPLYTTMSSVEDIRTFMEAHVFAVCRAHRHAGREPHSN